MILSVWVEPLCTSKYVNTVARAYDSRNGNCRISKVGMFDKGPPLAQRFFNLSWLRWYLGTLLYFLGGAFFVYGFILLQLGAGPPLNFDFLNTIPAGAAPPFAVFEGWASLLMVAGDFGERNIGRGARI